MVLTKEFLLNLKQNAVAQQQQHLQLVQQAKGAIDIIDYLLSQLDAAQMGNEDAPNSDSNDEFSGG